MAGGGIPKRSEMPITQDRFVHELLEGDIIMYDNQIWKYIKKLSYGGGGDMDMLNLKVFRTVEKLLQ